MADAPIEQLIDDYLCGGLDAEDSAALADRIDQHADDRVAFDAALHFEALLVAAHVPPVELERSRGKLRPPASRTRWRWMGAAAAAATILLAAGLYFAWAAMRSGDILVESGEVFVEGKVRTRLRGDQAFEVAAGKRAVLVFPDGVRADFNAASARLGGAAADARRGLRLERGSARFDVPEHYGKFLVETPSGTVATLGTVFSVDLNAPGAEVRVERGRVSVDFAERLHLVAVGETRRFGTPPLGSPLPKLHGLKAAVHGVVERSFDGESVAIRVTQVNAKLPGNKAAAPALLEKHSIRLSPGDRIEDDMLHRIPEHEAFLRGLKPGQDFSMAVVYLEQDCFKLLYVPKALGKHFDGQCGCKDAKEK